MDTVVEVPKKRPSLADIYKPMFLNRSEPINVTTSFGQPSSTAPLLSTSPSAQQGEGSSPSGTSPILVDRETLLRFKQMYATQISPLKVETNSLPSSELMFSRSPIQTSNQSALTSALAASEGHGSPPPPSSSSAGSNRLDLQSDRMMKKMVTAQYTDF